MTAPIQRIGALLTGGKATRLGGRPKGLITLSDSRPVLTHAIETLRGAGCQHILLMGDPAPYTPLLDAQIHPRPDVIPDRGAPGGVHGALHHALQQFGPALICTLACDMPRITAPLLTALLNAHPDPEVALYRTGRRLQPLAAWWHTRTEPELARRIQTEQPGLQRLARALNPTVLDAPDDLFMNLNTPEEVAAIGGRLPEWSTPSPS